MHWISLVTLGVEDLDAATRFYEALGWRRSGASNKDVTFLSGGAVALALFGRDALAEDARVPARGDGFRALAIAANVAEPHDVDLALRRAEAAGARVVKPAEDAPWGGRSGYFADLDGHLWEIAWNPHFPRAADGRLTLPP
ncbi:MAG TPA: VOC family protein [Candidatus Thermoplasmatota archaeon]|nr:VOC family protein [Candidatus Thermoplasmatota archaeon]